MGYSLVCVCIWSEQRSIYISFALLLCCSSPRVSFLTIEQTTSYFRSLIFVVVFYFSLPRFNARDDDTYTHEQNILDKFNPGARQLINAGKSYLKALHGKFITLHPYILFSRKAMENKNMWVFLFFFNFHLKKRNESCNCILHIIFTSFSFVLLFVPQCDILARGSVVWRFTIFRCV